MPVEDLGTDGRGPGFPPVGVVSSLVLLERLRNGELAAREELLQRYWPRLERWARGRLPASARDLYDTVDLVQETFLAVLGRLEDFEPESNASLQAYLRAAVLNRIRSLVKRSRSRGDRIALDREPEDPGQSPLERLIGRDAVERYERAMARLRPLDRQVIHLKVELDLPYEELTRELGKPSITAARMTLSRALCRLAQEMGRNA